MNFKGFLETSFVDWDGKICSVVFTPGCNFRCPFCFNHELVLKSETLEDVSEQAILDFLEKNRDFIDGICITGGEPTILRELPDFCKRVKETDFLVKLDTNGTNPKVLKELIDNKLVDYVAMDLKGQWMDYQKFVNVATDAEKIKENAQLLMNSGIDYEFRTTIVPSLHTKNVFEKIVSQVKGAKKYCLQKFQPGHCLDSAFDKEKKQSDEEMEEFAGIARKYVETVKIRGK